MLLYCDSYYINIVLYFVQFNLNFSRSWPKIRYAEILKKEKRLDQVEQETNDGKTGIVDTVACTNAIPRAVKFNERFKNRKIFSSLNILYYSRAEKLPNKLPNKLNCQNKLKLKFKLKIQLKLRLLNYLILFAHFDGLWVAGFTDFLNDN